MSIATLHAVNKSNKDQGQCGNCRTPLPKGSAYRWFVVGFRSKFKQVRCMEQRCTPSRAQRESSKLSTVYDALDSARETISTVESPEDAQAALQEAAESMQEVAEEYREASTDENGNVFNTMAEERADELEGLAGELEGWAPDEDEAPSCDLHEANGLNPEGEEVDCDDCAILRDEWIEAIRDGANSALDEADAL